MGRTRATHYALARDVRGLGDRWPVYRVLPDGQLRMCARLHALAPDRWWYEAAVPSSALLLGRPLGLFDDLPWFWDDLRPQGFLGRVFARRNAAQLGLADDPRLWSADGVIAALLLFGDDAPGDFVIGGQAAERFQKKKLEDVYGIPRRQRPQRYAELAEKVLAGIPVGSSAGGEQPKFVTRVAASDGVRDVIVKLSPPRDTASGRRWADLLLAEHLAAQRLSAHGVPAAKTEWIDGTDRAFLEVTRFDRVGNDGRRGVVSLFALDAELYGAHDTWPNAAERLLRDGWISRESARELELLWWFGKLIANSDLHFGNVTFFSKQERPFELAPAYDMLPMGLAPRGQGEVAPYPSIVEPPPPESMGTWRAAAVIAEDFWSVVGADRRASRDFAAQARRYSTAVKRLVDQHA